MFFFKRKYILKNSNAITRVTRGKTVRSRSQALSRQSGGGSAGVDMGEEQVNNKVLGGETDELLERKKGGRTF